jgi:hypothetical protein
LQALDRAFDAKHNVPSSSTNYVKQASAATASQLKAKRKSDHLNDENVNNDRTGTAKKKRKTDAEKVRLI